MKRYSPQNNIPILGLTLLVIGSLILGLAGGAVAYLISNFLYLILIFPIVFGGLITFAYRRLVDFAKIRHSLITSFIGFGVGILIAFSFYGTPYLAVRQQFISDAQEQYNIEAQTASNGFDRILMEETGTDGFWGFMKLRAMEGDNYSTYLIYSNLPIVDFNFTLKSNLAWIYWSLETILFGLPIALMGFNFGKGDFSKTVQDWYSPYSKQIASATLDRKEELLSLLKTGNLMGTVNFLLAEDELSHPKLEIHEQRTENNKGDILLSVVQTIRESSKIVKRNVIAQWEISQQEYLPFIDNLDQIINAG